MWFEEYLLARPNREHQWLRWLIVAASPRSMY
jgi:hypothetical protein